MATRQYKTKSEHVYEMIQERITSNVWKHGMNIKISTIAQELKVSPIPVREALKRLESDGLVDIVPHKGAYVKTFDHDKIKETLAIRSVLEAYAARMAVKNITEKELTLLRETNKRMAEYSENQDYIKYVEANKEFHRIIYEKSQYPLLYEMILKLWDGGGNWQKAIFSLQPKKMRPSINEHLMIIDALEKKDEEAVEKLVRAHKERVLIRFEEFASSNNALF